MATFPKTAITGTRNTELPRSPSISGNVLVVLPITVLNGGTLNSGNPDLTSPVNLKGEPVPFSSYVYAMALHIITTIAFLDVDISHRV